MARKRDDVEQILQTCLELIQTGQETVDSALARYPEQADELRPLLEAASWLQMRSTAVTTNPGFVTASRRRLEARLEREKAASVSKAPHVEDLGLWNALEYLFTQKNFVFRFAMATLMVILFVMTTNRVVNAAQQAIPGDGLYPVKISIEKVNLALAFSEARRAQLNINFAERRLEEIQRLVDEKRFEHLASTIDQFQTNAEQARIPLQTLESKDAPQAKALANELTNVIDENTVVLPAQAQDVPQGAQQEISRLAGLTSDVRKNAERIEKRPLNTATPVAGLSPRTDTPVPPAPTDTSTNTAVTDTPAPSETTTPTPTPTPEDTLVSPSETPTPTESPEVDETRIATTTMTPRSAPVVSFTDRSQIVTEGNRVIPVKVQLGDSLGNPVIANQDVAVPFTVTGSATKGLDFTVSSSPLVISAGSSSANIIVSLNDDGFVEPDETAVITMGEPSNAALGSRSTYSLTVTHGPTVFFTLASQSVHENAASIDIEVQLAQEQATDVTIPFSLGGSASVNRDYTLKSANPLVIPAGQTKGYISLALVADGLDEPDETIEVTLNSPDGARLGLPSTQILTLIDDDPVPEVAFARGDQSVSESVGAVSVQLQLSAVSSQPITVPLSLSGSATQGIDIHLYQTTVIIPPGSSSASFNIEVVNDLLPESYETVVITLGQPANAVLGTPNAYLLTLVDDDPQPVVTFAGAGQSVEEGVGVVSVQVQLSAVSSLPITVPLSLSGSATPGIDYVFDQPSVVIPPGNSSALLTIQVINDQLPESYETVVIALGQPTNASLGMPNAYPLTLIDDDPQPEVAFIQSDQSVDESVGNVSVEVQLTAVSSLPITVPLSLSGSATPGIDYLFDQPSVVIPPGSSSASFDVQIVDDLIPESSEVIEITLEQPANAVIVVPVTQTITILPNDQPACNIFAINGINTSVDNKGLEWTLSNQGSDTLLLTQLTINWPTEIFGRPSLSKVFFDNELIFTGNEPFSPQTITSWISHDSRRLLNASPSTIAVRFTHPILPGNYMMTLVFHNVTQDFDCAPVTQSIDIP